MLAGSKVTHRAQMELRIAPIAGSAAKTWTQTYSGQPPRHYEIQSAEAGAGHFIMDEKNGVLLEEQLIGDTLLSAFQVGDVLLTSRFLRCVGWGCLRRATAISDQRERRGSKRRANGS